MLGMFGDPTINASAPIGVSIAPQPNDSKQCEASKTKYQKTLAKLQKQYANAKTLAARQRIQGQMNTQLQTLMTAINTNCVTAPDPTAKLMNPDGSMQVPGMPATQNDLGGGLDTTWIIAGGAVIAGALGLYLFLRRKG